ncbi:hypothetical protein BC827DRAFT_1386756 [Russula dissimulans]|nr:hypothetical protein BC827DRAFT_1386756 [Russula dissimulans]
MTALDGVNGTVCNADQYSQSLTSHDSRSPLISCLTHGQSIGLALTAGSSFISLASVLVILICRNVLWYRKKFPGGDWKLFRGPSDIYMFTLFSFDILQALGGVLDVRWAHNAIVTRGSYWEVQGIIQQIGELEVALTTLVLAVHTFVGALWRVGLEAPRFAFRLVGFVCVFITLGVSIGAATHGNYEVPTPYWCWVSPQFPGERLGGEYVWLWALLRLDPDNIDRWRSFWASHPPTSLRTNPTEDLVRHPSNHLPSVRLATKPHSIEPQARDHFYNTSLPSITGKYSQRTLRSVQGSPFTELHSIKPKHYSHILKSEIKVSENRGLCLKFLRECVRYGENVVMTCTAFVPYSSFSRPRKSQDLVDDVARLGTEWHGLSISPPVVSSLSTTGTGDNTQHILRSVRLSLWTELGSVEPKQYPFILKAEIKFSENRRLCDNFLRECVRYGEHVVMTCIPFVTYPSSSWSKNSRDLVDDLARLGTERTEVSTETAVQPRGMWTFNSVHKKSVSLLQRMDTELGTLFSCISAWITKLDAYSSSPALKMIKDLQRLSCL